MSANGRGKGSYARQKSARYIRVAERRIAALNAKGETLAAHCIEKTVASLVHERMAKPEKPIDELDVPF